MSEQERALGAPAAGTAEATQERSEATRAGATAPIPPSSSNDCAAESSTRTGEAERSPATVPPKCPATCVACAAIAAGRSVHCWEDGPVIHVDDGTLYGEDLGSTCMLEHAHPGDHEFLSDDRIKLSFAAEPPLKALEIPAPSDSKG